MSKPSPRCVRPRSTSRSGAASPGRGRSSSALATEKIVVFAPIPMASERAAVRVKRGLSGGAEGRSGRPGGASRAWWPSLCYEWLRITRGGAFWFINEGVRCDPFCGLARSPAGDDGETRQSHCGVRAHVASGATSMVGTASDRARTTSASNCGPAHRQSSRIASARPWAGR